MKTIKLTLMVLAIIILQACSAGATTEAAAPQEPINPPTTATRAPNTPEVSQSTSDASTSVPLSSLPIVATEPASASENIIPESGLTLDDNGKTFKLKVGDSFLLNLGTDVYEWTVNIDNQNVLHLKMGVMVIRGAQGIYDTLTPGTAILTASGDPLCRTSQPACASPSILFTVTLIVE